MNAPKIGLQGIIFGERNRTDFESILIDLKKAGYDHLESGNLFKSQGEDNARKLMEKYGVTQAGAHFGYGDYSNAEQLLENIRYCKAMGVKYMLCSGVSDASKAEGYQESAKTFNMVGEKLADEGIRFCYHNHNWEFNDLGGVRGIDILAEKTDPHMVGFNVDVFWVTFAGFNPAEFITKHADRVGYFHFKDGLKNEEGKPIFLELGCGMVDLKACVEAAQQTRLDWIVVEQDNTARTPLESIGMSRTTLRNHFGW